MSSSFARRHRRFIRKSTGQWVESLEQRRLLSVVTINAAQTLRSVDTNLLGVNLATWDGLIATGGSTTVNSQTQQLVAAAGLQAFRIPGGSTADTFHFNVNNGSQGASVAAMAELVASVNGVGVSTVNYGTGSPQEGAAMLAYLNAPINDPAVDNVAIGNGEQWNGSKWVEVNWQTAGYWASLRAATPLAKNDGLNFLRIGRSAPFGFHYWEMGNEEYGSWETDEHGASGDTLPMPAGATPKPHDPTTYISFSEQFATLAAQIDPTISIGISTQSTSTSDFSGWIVSILQQSVAQGFTPGFLSDHMYPYGGGDTGNGSGQENDAELLGFPTTPESSANTYDLAQRAADYRSLLTQYLGTAANNVELLGTEYNSVYNYPGKQSTSIVNAMFIDDSIGAMMDSGANGYDGLWVWDLHNGDLTGDNNASSLYGWRPFGDYGMLGTNTTPAGAGSNEPYPDYYAEQIASKIIQSGGTVVQSSTDNSNLGAYSVIEPNGDLDVMVINNTSPSNRTPPNNLPDPGLLEALNFQGFTPSGGGTTWQYGVAQDDAQDTSGSTSLANSTAAFTVTNGSFNYTFPDYSVTVMDLKPVVVPTVGQAAAATPNPVTGVFTDLTALGSENGGDTGLTYTWSATGPSAVLYSANGTNAAKNDIATFSQAGSYSFTVTITDSGGQQTTSSVGVTIVQTPTLIAVTPSAPSLAISTTDPFSATATDQFGNGIASPTFTWSVTGSANSINGGLLNLGATPGTYTITAAIGTVQGTATVTALAAPAVSDFIVNDGNVQRSMVDSLTVDFSEPVTLAAGAITLTQRSPTGGAPTPESFTLSNPSGDQETYVLTFTGSPYIGNSLPNGVYDLVVQAALITNAANSTLSGSNQTFSFYRLFGDFDGTGQVDLTSLVVVASNFGSTSSSPGWLWYADFNGDGSIDLTELVVVASDFGASLSTSDYIAAAVTIPAAAPLSSTQDATPAAPISAPAAVTAVSDPPAPTPAVASVPVTIPTLPTAPPTCEESIPPTPPLQTNIVTSTPLPKPAAKVAVAASKIVAPPSPAVHRMPIANHPTFGGWGSITPADNGGDLASWVDSADPTELRSA